MHVDVMIRRTIQFELLVVSRHYFAAGDSGLFLHTFPCANCCFGCHLEVVLPLNVTHVADLGPFLVHSSSELAEQAP